MKGSNSSAELRCSLSMADFALSASIPAHLSGKNTGFALPASIPAHSSGKSFGLLKVSAHLLTTYIHR